MSPESRCPQRIGWGATPSSLVSPSAKRSGASNTCGTSSRNPCSSRPGPATQGNEPTSATEHRGPKPGAQSAELRPPRVRVGGRSRPSVLLVDARDGLSGPPERPPQRLRARRPPSAARGRCTPRPASRPLASSARPSPRATPAQGVPGPHFLVSRAPFVPRRPSVPAQPRRAHLCSRSDPQRVPESEARVAV